MDKTAPKRLLRFVSWVALGMAILLLAWSARQLLFTRYLIPRGDFIEYWSAGRLLLAGDNPYDPTRLLAVQQAAGRVSTRPLLMYKSSVDFSSYHSVCASSLLHQSLSVAGFPGGRSIFLRFLSLATIFWSTAACVDKLDYSLYFSAYTYGAFTWTTWPLRFARRRVVFEF